VEQRHAVDRTTTSTTTTSITTSMACTAAHAYTGLPSRTPQSGCRNCGLFCFLVVVALIVANSTTLSLFVAPSLEVDSGAAPIKSIQKGNGIDA